MRFLVVLCCLCSSLFGAEKVAVWFTGLPCSGKTTIAKELQVHFPGSVLLDGDEVRSTINKDLGFSDADRKENLRRIVEIGKLILQSVDYVLIPVVSPREEVRAMARQSFEDAGYRFIEVYVDAPLDVCVQRDVKGMYKKALNGEIKSFTGISAPYEAPTEAQVICKTAEESVKESAKKIIVAMNLPDPTVPHALFVGRWSPFHRGHWAIMDAVRQKNPNRPLLIFVRDTETDAWPVAVRKEMIEKSMKEMNIAARVMIIPNIDSVNWGRDVGYERNYVDVDSSVHAISGTEIRKCLKSGDQRWKENVCPGVAEVIEAYEAVR